MARRIREVRDMEIDEVSLVDRPANPFAKVAIAKRAPEEETVPDYYSETGEAIDLSGLEFGDRVFDAAGNEYEFVQEDPEDENDDEGVEELVGAGVSKSLADSVREELSKALTDVERNETIAKALDEVSKADQRAKVAEEIAKSERLLRLEREYISKAAEYNVPIKPEELGPVLMHLGEAELEGKLPKGTGAVIHKALAAAGELIFTEIGYQGGGDNADIMSMVDQAIAQELSKAQTTEVTKEQMVTKMFENDDSMYEQYLADRANR